MDIYGKKTILLTFLFKKKKRSLEKCDYLEKKIKILG
jgi:hypothetical protein